MKKYELDGETFQLDDSKGCYIEVTYEDLTGYVGVNLNGTAKEPFCFGTNSRAIASDGQGLTNGVSAGPDEESNLQGLCRVMVETHRQDLAKKTLDRKGACEALHKFMEKLPG